MTVPQLTTHMSLDEIRDQLVYSHARLAANALTVSLASAIDPLLARWTDVKAGQVTVWDEELRAQAVVDDGNDGLDDVVRAFERDLRSVLPGEDRSAPRYTRYFPHPASEIIRLGLESELTRVREWPESIAAEVGPPGTHAAPLRTAITKGDAAVTRRARAITATADHRVRQIVTFVDDANAARLSLHGRLESIASEHGLPKSFADRFFRHAPRPGAVAPAAATAPVAAPAS